MKCLFLLLASIFIIGCAQSKKSYYVLSASGPVPSTSGVSVGVGPITLAEYLDRPNLVISESPNQLAIAEDHRWAGGLSQSISQVLAADLGRHLKTGNVQTYPWLSDNEVRYQVTLDVRRFHSESDGHAVIEVGWRAYQLPERTLKTSRTFVAREPLSSDGYAAMVAAQSRLLEGLAAQIAASLR
jgi:uncharacterized protein